jgi:AcrR family transcriptional regulator
MSNARPVKKRSYSSSTRERQAAETRARIVEKAAQLFESDGYGRTTIRRIAEEAGVAPDTVYATFGSKIRVLTAIIDTRLAPGGEPNLMQRPEALAVRDEPDQERKLELFARDMNSVLARVGPVYEILRTAAAVETDAAAVYAEMNRHRLANLTNVARWLAERGPLRVDVERAGEIIWVLASPDVARLLKDLRGWSDQDYASWLADTLKRTILPDKPGSRRRGPAPLP